jgi:methionyl-tRNA synthetase
VIDTCPYCNYDQARGDQCENCTRVLDPADLINPRSAVSGSPEIEILPLDSARREALFREFLEWQKRQSVETVFRDFLRPQEQDTEAR